MDKIIHAALFTPTRRGWGLSLVLWGSPGTGKTERVRALSESLGLPVEVLSPAERGEGAFGAVPVPQGGVLTYPPPEWAADMLVRGGVILLDELTDTPPALRPAVNGLLLDRRIGGLVLPGGVRTIACANPVDESADGYEMALTTANRVGHLICSAPTVAEHIEFMLGTARPGSEIGDLGVEEARVMREWPAAWASARAAEAGFLQRRPGLKNQQPAPSGTLAWPSDRTWEMATRALASARVHRLTPTETELFVSAFIGNAAASEWQVWRDEQDLPDPVAILDGVEGFVPDRRLDRTHAVITACSTLVLETHEEHPDRTEAFWSLCSDLIGGGAPDLLVSAVTALVRAGLHGSDAASRAIDALGPVLESANYGG